MLADSEYRHQLEADIAPFKGLLLGLFFIAVGMFVNIGLLVEIPGQIALLVLLLMVTKAIVLFPLARFFGMCDRGAALKLAAVLAQGGEFAFVLLGIAATQSVLPAALIDKLFLAVALSMLLTPFIYAAAEYSASKFHKPKVKEFGEFGIRVNCICPGPVAGDRIERVIAAEAKVRGVDPEEVRESHTRNISLHCFVEPEDIAATALFLCSDAGARITGQAISVDGNTETRKQRSRCPRCGVFRTGLSLGRAA